ncbi:uncharacterized protein FOMMEDRAFT_168553 [Fomitiporia mediterranea MF3/22]|uniref:uncharacterized protein n=1 Tax=Fomitiporia mediterranea (strain MF3/22) TaxID=694068 RepID=UPI0004409918|nr:uncharacterized protein FOMMEDRAFT_168553 [Fomitiporia mediterranea MF3/22]EJD01985.1 hypothetical protein FOMMEDRAFT_168553 [Fomitiporia mediterranea MF3/22]
MTSILARPPRLARVVTHFSRRNFVRSVPALKKRAGTASSQGALDDDELFKAPSDEDSLFSSSLGSQQPISQEQPVSAFSRPHVQKKARKTSVKSPFEQFAEQYAYISARLGPNPTEKHPQARHSGIRRLLHHAQGKEHLEQVVEILAKWRSSGKAIDLKTTRELIDRCLAWSPPTLVTILSDRQKYGLTLPNMTDARRILRRLIFYRPHPIAQQSSSTNAEGKARANAEALKNAVTFAALLPSHGLRKPMEDVVCCALLAQACARNVKFTAALEASTHASKQGETDTSDPTSENQPKSDTSSKPAHYDPTSTRGLLSTSNALATLFSSPNLPSELRTLPSPEYVSALIEKHKAAPRGLGGIENPDIPRQWTWTRGMDDPAVFRKRTSGVTYSGLVEQRWAVSAIRDIVQALKDVQVSNPGAGKKSLAVLEQVLGNTIGEEDAEKVPASTTWEVRYDD